MGLPNNRSTDSLGPPPGDGAIASLLEAISCPVAIVDAQRCWGLCNAPFRTLIDEIGAASARSLAELIDEDRETIDAVFDRARRAAVTHRWNFVDGVARTLRLRKLDETVPSRWVVTVRRSERAQLRHDLAGPLTTVAGIAELLLLHAGPVGSEVERGLRQIGENCSRMVEIVAPRRDEEGHDE